MIEQEKETHTDRKMKVIPILPIEGKRKGGTRNKS